jgi:CheY-like chemotaxis protein
LKRGVIFQTGAAHATLPPRAVCSDMSNPGIAQIHPPIIAIDDDEDDVDLLRIMLRKAGIPNPMQVYREGEKALQALTKLAQESLRPLLCFLDVKMPAISGIDILKWIRTTPALNSMPVVMLSTSDQPGDVLKAAQNGAQCYLVKYPQPAVLKAIVDDAERFALGSPAEDCFRLPNNQLLTRGRRL